ncbi:MAG: diacylglycerol kinase family protein [Candidatus Sericytochromatia bacterium]|nr:diacylglycerol kinase family protein [Candidatus Sericytochromatia bacterium]
MKAWLLAFFKGFKWAFSGLFYAIQTQRNLQVHLAATLLASGLSFWLGLSRLEWILLLLTFALVWMAEMVNTALEATLDHLAPEIHPQVKIAKDVAAGAVLVAALFAVLIGILLWGPRLLNLLRG